MIGFIRTATHDRIVAEKDAVNDGLLTRLQHAEDLNRRYVSKIERLEGQLAVFTAPRQRGPRGRFLSTKGAV